MARVRFITRADDLGSSNSANLAIDAVTRAGFFKNASIMAAGPCVEQAAQLLACRKDICFGMHTTLNAEWDAVKWKPLLPLDPKSGLVDAAGFFLNDPALFIETKPQVETIMREVDAQLERLHALGFDIRYIDSHMFPELFVEGLDESMREFAFKKGLLDHMHYYALPPGFKALNQNPSHPLRYLKALPAGQYFFVAHPSLYTQEMLQTGNAAYSGEVVAKGRAGEAKMFSNRALMLLFRLAGCEGIRYDEAKPQERLNVQDIKRLLS